jgi:hypothetical protein
LMVEHYCCLDLARKKITFAICVVKGFSSHHRLGQG